MCLKEVTSAHTAAFIERKATEVFRNGFNAHLTIKSDVFTEKATIDEI